MSRRLVGASARWRLFARIDDVFRAVAGLPGDEPIAAALGNLDRRGQNHSPLFPVQQFPVAHGCSLD